MRREEAFVGDQTAPGTSPEETKQCPACAEEIRSAAVLCRFCGYDFRTGAVPQPAAVPARREGAGPHWSPPTTQAPQRTNGLAVASLVLGIVGLILFVFFMVVPILALIFGLVAISQISQSGETQSGHGMAVAGTILGVVGILFFLLLFASGGHANFNFG